MLPGAATLDAVRRGRITCAAKKMAESGHTRHHVRGQFAATAARLRELLRSVDRCAVAADLSLGSATAHTTAKQIAAQLGIALPTAPESQRRPLTRGVRSYADSIAHGIDTESMGNRIVDGALRFARSFEERAMTLFVILPRAGAWMEDEDLLLLVFLIRQQTDLRFVCCDQQPPPLPDGWTVEWDDGPRSAERLAPSLMSLWPGVIGPHSRGLDKEAHRDGVVDLGGGFCVIAPERRRAIGEISKLEWDRLAMRARQVDPDVAAFAQFHGNNIYVDPQALCERAWWHFDEGGVGLALRYLGRVQECAKTADESAAAQAQRQGMRIAQLHFEDAAREPEPAAHLEKELRAFLLQAKGWGCVQTGAVAEARSLFARAWQLMENGAAGKREALYLLNIRALAEFRSDNAEEALRLENVIESELATLEHPDRQLSYINAINQARIHKLQRDFTRAEACYARAFAITWGLRSESDRVYTNVCLAALAEASGHPEAALPAWLRAALHWVASSRPEALTWRIARALVPRLTFREALPNECARVVNEISAALLRKLEDAARACGRAPESPPRRGSRFATIDDVRGEWTAHYAVGGCGWSVLAASARVESIDHGTAHRRLQSWLGSFIERGHSVADGDVYLVDARCGRELAVDFHELLETGLRRHVREVWYEGESTQIDDATRRTLESHTTIHLGAGVESVGADGATVWFKRYRPPRSLTAAEARLVDAVRRAGAMKLEDDAVVHSLEEACILERGLERLGCAAAGIKLPSTES
jgi:tetratricopeptide (TPR) repeat protein